MSPETSIYEDSTTTRLELYKPSDLVRMYVGDVLIYAGHYSTVGSVDFTLFEEHFVFDGESAEELWETIRLSFRKNQNGLKWTKTVYESPFGEDTHAVYLGTITAADFVSYPETSVQTTSAQDGDLPVSGHKVEAVFDEAIEKLEAVNGGAIATPRVNLTHALLCAVREYSRCHDGLNALRGLGLEDATKLARDINAQERITENSVAVFSYRLMAQAITANKFA